jgi:hypothetical protein
MTKETLCGVEGNPWLPQEDDRFRSVALSSGCGLDSFLFPELPALER